MAMGALDGLDGETALARGAAEGGREAMLGRRGTVTHQGNGAGGREQNLGRGLQGGGRRRTLAGGTDEEAGGSGAGRP
eukprot:1960345-Prymnesium_polylepis.1